MQDEEIRERSWTAYYNALFPDPTFPPKPWEIDVAGYLFERGYHATSARAVLMHAMDHGSVEGCRVMDFDPRDRAIVESKLPEAPVGNWHRLEYDGNWRIAG